MKLIIQIPSFNEEKALPITLKNLPREVDGVDQVEWLVVDDGSTDQTLQVARAGGVDHVVSHTHNKGLAKTFMTGLEESVRLGADIIVNTDADNQYPGDKIPELIKPILANKADMVIGARPIDSIKDFSSTKKILQRIGSWVVRVASDTEVRDAPSGFRAITRELASQLNVFNTYTYTLETVIQAGQLGYSIQSIPVNVNSVERPSRLVKSSLDYVLRSALTIIRIFAVYKPFRFFTYLGLIPFTLGLMLGFRFVINFLTHSGAGNIQSLILCAIFILTGIQLFIFAMIADLISVNRALLTKANSSYLNKSDFSHTKKGSCHLRSMS